MFHTIEYKGHYIHITYYDNREGIVVQFVRKYPDGSEHYTNYGAKSLLSAKRMITKFIKGE